MPQVGCTQTCCWSASATSLDADKDFCLQNVVDNMQCLPGQTMWQLSPSWPRGVICPCQATLIFFQLTQEKPLLPAQNYMLITQVLSTVPCVVGTFLILCPSPLLLMNSCFPEQLSPGNWITDEENICCLNSSLPGNFWHQSIIISACAPYLS